MIRWLFALLGYSPASDRDALLAEVERSAANAKYWRDQYEQQWRSREGLLLTVRQLERENARLSRPWPFYREGSSC